MACFAIKGQIVRRINENFIDTVHMYVLRCDIFEVNIVDASTVFHIERHAGRRSDIGDSKGGVYVQFFRIIRFSGKGPAWSRKLPAAIRLLHLCDDIE